MMKTKLFITTIIAMIISATILIGQERTDYQEIDIAEYPSSNEGYITSMSASYYFGQSWFFQWTRDESIWNEGWKLNYSAFTANSDGTFEEHMLGKLESVGLQFLNNPQLNSCVFHNTLFVFYSYRNDDSEYKIGFWTKTPYTEIYESMNEISINEEITRQMAAVGVNDTLYLFFVDHADGKVKYYRAKYKSAANGYPIGLEWISSTPTIISNSLIPHGNVSACSYTDENNHEKIMLAYASNSSDRNSNEVIMFSGTHNNFELFKQFETQADYPAENIYIAQGSVKGGEKNAYMFQLGYCNPDVEENQGPIRCELRYDNQNVSDWEITTVNSYGSPGNKLSGFMAYFTKHSTKREKHLYQMCIDEYTPLRVYGLHWYSDKLEYADKLPPMTAPFNYGGSFFDLVLVAEGPPPYTLNGRELNDTEFDGNPPSVFDYVVTNGEAVSTKSTYSLGVETNMGYGPVTAGFKASFQESSGTSATETVSVTQELIPPKINSDSAGLMWYYYVTPSVVRERWVMKDYDGDLLHPERNLFFFKLNSPQLLDTAMSFVNYDTNSPRAYNLETYKARDVGNISGVEEIIHKEGDVDYGGNTPSIDITFSESHTTTHTESFEVSVGIDAEEGIFSASATVTASLEYEVESTTTCEYGFDINWNLISSGRPDYDSNIIRFTPTAYIMKATDGSAYFLDNESVPENFKKFRPFFITYDVGEIIYGNFLDPPFSIGENATAAEKYNFRNYPNPFNHQSKFEYTLPHRSNVSLSIYNAYGQLVSMPVNETQSMGNHQIDIISTDLPSGIYHYRLLIDEDLIMGKIIKN